MTGEKNVVMARESPRDEGRPSSRRQQRDRWRVDHPGGDTANILADILKLDFGPNIDCSDRQGPADMLCSRLRSGINKHARSAPSQHLVVQQQQTRETSCFLP